jgi:hypothetical protein
MEALGLYLAPRKLTGPKSIKLRGRGRSLGDGGARRSLEARPPGKGRSVRGQKPRFSTKLVSFDTLPPLKLTNVV